MVRPQVVEQCVTIRLPRNDLIDEAVPLEFLPILRKTLLVTACIEFIVLIGKKVVFVDDKCCVAGVEASGDSMQLLAATPPSSASTMAEASRSHRAYHSGNAET
jgi:hypothetical protein